MGKVLLDILAPQGYSYRYIHKGCEEEEYILSPCQRRRLPGHGRCESAAGEEGGR